MMSATMQVQVNKKYFIMIHITLFYTFNAKIL